MQLGAIGQIAIHVRELDRAVQFYRDRLGLRFLFQAPPGLAFFDAGGVRLMLSRPEGAAAGTSILYFQVDDIPQAVAALRARGVHFTAEPHLIARLPDHDLWMAFFLDSEDNTMALMSEVPRRG
ncbi:MAG TPA: VOC family protein [bacterium]|nr:VOC family protein [bacterium]